MTAGPHLVGSARHAARARRGIPRSDFESPGGPNSERCHRSTVTGLVARLMAIDPEDRSANGRELAIRLAAAIRSTSVASSAAGRMGDRATRLACRRSSMVSPLVCCLSCERTWHSATMAEGLRALDGCPRCRGELRFSDAAPAPVAADRMAVSLDDTAPHLVLGAPRR